MSYLGNFRAGLLREWPECSVCNAPVQLCETRLMESSNDCEVIVCCHGETERIRIPFKVIAGAARITVGQAFIRKALPEDEPKALP